MCICVKYKYNVRYPDINPEHGMQFDPNSGWIGYETKWKPPKVYPNATDIIQTADNWPGVQWVCCLFIIYIHINSIYVHINKIYTYIHIHIF